jgi:hypothetical protein
MSTALFASRCSPIPFVTQNHRGRLASEFSMLRMSSSLTAAFALSVSMS